MKACRKNTEQFNDASVWDSLRILLQCNLCFYILNTFVSGDASWNWMVMGVMTTTLPLFTVIHNGKQVSWTKWDSGEPNYDNEKCCYLNGYDVS